MKEFTIRPENRSRTNKSSTVLAFILLAATAAGGCSRYYRTPGTVLPVNIPLTAETTRSITENELKLDEDYGFKNDFKLTIESGGNRIEFAADGCDPGRKLAYEWVAAPDYGSQPDDARLNDDERTLIVDHVFGEWTIFVIDSEYERTLENDLYLFRVYLQDR
jgi:hypothetical protein